jgi:hypothetical protein
MSENEIPETPENAEGEEAPEVEAHSSVLDLQGTEGVSAPVKGGGNCVSLVSVVEGA